MNKPDPATLSPAHGERTERAGGDLPLPTYMPMLETFVLRSPGGTDWPEMLRRAALVAAACAILAVGAMLVLSAMVLAMALVPAIILGFLGALLVGGSVTALDRVKLMQHEARKEQALYKAEQP